MCECARESNNSKTTSRQIQVMPLVFSSVTAKFPAAGTSGGGKDNDVVMKIRKMLDLALHPGTPEHEATQAMRRAQREMEKYNLDQARVMLETSSAADATVAANVFWVRVRTEAGKHPSFWRWMTDLLLSVSNAFQCKSFYTADDIRFTTYGPEESASAAIEAFVRYAKYIDQRTRSHRPACVMSRSGGMTPLQLATALRTERIAFCNGMVSGLAAAYAEDKQKAKRRETRLREYVQLYASMEETGDDLCGDVLDAMAVELGIHGGGGERAAATQQLVLVETVEKRMTDACEDMKKALNLKIKTGPKRAVSGKSSTSFADGFREGKRLKAMDAQPSQQPRLTK